MNTGYKYQAKDGRILSNINDNCAKCIAKSGSKTIVASCVVFQENRRCAQKRIDKDGAMLYICSGSKIKSSRIFWERFDVYAESLSQILCDQRKERELERTQAKRHIHNLVELNARAIQCIYSKIPQDTFIKRDRDELLKGVADYVVNNPGDTAKLILDLLKNETLKKTEFSVYSKIFEQERPQLLSYPLHKIVLLVLNSFWDELKEKDVHILLDEYRDNVLADFDALSASLTHIFSNTAKYILPRTPLHIRFRTDGQNVTCRFEMTSLRIEDSEERKIFENGYSGAEPKRLGRDGNGLGLWVVRSLLESMGSSISAERDIDPSARKHKMGLSYEKNAFTMTLPRGN